MFSTSRNGLSWTTPTTLPLGPGNHVIAGLAADPVRPGRVAVAFYTELAAGLDVRFVTSLIRHLQLPTKRNPI